MKCLSSCKRVLSLLLLASCADENAIPSKELIDQINLKRGSIISCAGTEQEFGTVDFDMSCDQKAKKDFNLGMELLHSFEYDESEKAFAKVIDQTPACAMAYWGIAMSNFHPLWSPPTEQELQKGSMAIAIANQIKGKSERETGYIHAVEAYYANWNTTNHRARCLNFEKAMEQLHAAYPEDKEASIFYALSLVAAADPTDKTYSKQKKAGDLLNAFYTNTAGHPGIIHYIIHAFDYPGIAVNALPAARQYAKVAPSSAHALHMPSHIFTRLGLWDEDIQSNKESVSAAKCYAESSGIGEHWDEELHGMDYLVYAYLQKGDNKAAAGQLQYMQSMKEVKPVTFKVAYAFAAMPSRMVLENKDWAKAATLQVQTPNFTWAKFPWQESIIHFTRLLGAVHMNDKPAATVELNTLQQLQDSLKRKKEAYNAQQVAVQIKTGEAWMQYAFGDKQEALNTMKAAAAMEDSTEKHSVTPGEVLPARELLGDMLSQMKQYDKALQVYEQVMQRSPGRFNTLYGAGLAAERSGNTEKAVLYYRQLAAGTTNSERPEMKAVRSYLAKQ